MGVSAGGRPSARPAFVATSYQASERGLTPDLPSRGPCWIEASPCAIGVHHLRRRSSGPPWGWVAVARCREHSKAFTVYPPGHVPYGRVPLVDLAPDGAAVRDGDPTEGTSFAAAVDAAAAEPRLWPVHSAPEPPGAVRSTQRRRVREGTRLLGLSGESPGPEVAAAVSHLSCGVLVEARARLDGERSLSAWGRAVIRVVRDLIGRAGRALMDRLAVLGHLAGRWGRPYRWLPRPKRLLELGRPFWANDDPGTRHRPPR